MSCANEFEREDDRAAFDEYIEYMDQYWEEQDVAWYVFLHPEIWRGSGSQRAADACYHWAWSVCDQPGCATVATELADFAHQDLERVGMALADALEAGFSEYGASAYAALLLRGAVAS